MERYPRHLPNLQRWCALSYLCNFLLNYLLETALKTLLPPQDVFVLYDVAKYASIETTNCTGYWYTKIMYWPIFSCTDSTALLVYLFTENKNFIDNNKLTFLRKKSLIANITFRKFWLFHQKLTTSPTICRDGHWNTFVKYLYKMPIQGYTYTCIYISNFKTSVCSIFYHPYKCWPLQIFCPTLRFLLDMILRDFLLAPFVYLELVLSHFK